MYHNKHISYFTNWRCKFNLSSKQQSLHDVLLSLFQATISPENVVMLVNDLNDVVSQANETVDQSTGNLEVIARVFSGAVDLIESGAITVNDEVSRRELILSTVLI